MTKVRSLALVDRGEERHALEVVSAQQEHAAALRHDLDQQHAGHQRIAGEVALEDRAFERNEASRSSWCAPRGRGDALSISCKYSSRIPLLPSTLPRRPPEALLTATNSSMRAQRFLRTKYCSVVALRR